jgi:hypothetical protein
MSRSNGYFVLGGLGFYSRSDDQLILTEVLTDFLRSLHAEAVNSNGTVSSIRPRHLVSTSFPTHCTLPTLPFHSLYLGRPRDRSSSPGRVKNFVFSASSRPVLGPTQPPIQWVQWALSLEVKRPGREADHLPPTSAEVQKTWIYTSTPPYAFMA